MEMNMLTGGETRPGPDPYPSPDNPPWVLSLSFTEAGRPTVIQADLRDFPAFTLGDPSAQVVLDFIDEQSAVSAFTDVEAELVATGWWPQYLNPDSETPTPIQTFVQARFVGRTDIAAQLGLAVEP